MPTVLALHGQSLNGAHMRRELGYLDALGAELVCPDAPHACPAALVDRIYALLGTPREPPPHGAWWDASDDGRTYHGWEATRELLAPILERGPLGIVGFSQGAIVATALAALAQHGQLRAQIAYVVLVAGRAPRADVITPFLREPIRTPSLHVWGESDTLIGNTSRELVDLYATDTRQVVTWPGPHAIPQDGPAARAIADFVKEAR